MIASVATTAGLSAQRSAEGLSPLKEGEVVRVFAKNTPSVNRLLYEAKASVVATNAIIPRWPPNLRGQSRDLDNCYIISNIFIEYFHFLKRLYPINIAGATNKNYRCDCQRRQVRQTEIIGAVTRNGISVFYAITFLPLGRFLLMSFVQ